MILPDVKEQWDLIVSNVLSGVAVHCGFRFFRCASKWRRYKVTR